MPNRITFLIIDATDVERLSEFWAQVLGWQVLRRGSYWATIGGENSPLEINFRAVPDGPKTGKNRLHLDIRPTDVAQADELERLLRLGARQVDVGQPPGCTWYVLADPEGNEFCLCAPDSVTA